RVFPVSDSGPGSVFGLITGDPDPATPSRERVVPVCNRDLIPADSPAHGLGARLPIHSSFLFQRVLPWPHRRPTVTRPPHLPAPRKLRTTAKPITVAKPGPSSRTKPVVRKRSATSKLCPCNILTRPASTSVHAPTGSASASPPTPLPA